MVVNVKNGPLNPLAFAIGVDASNKGARSKLFNSATSSPTTANDSSQGYQIGSSWVRTDTGQVFTCRDASVGAAVWIGVTGTGKVVYDTSPAFAAFPTGVRFPLMYSGGTTTQAGNTTAYYGSGLYGSAAPAGTALILPAAGTLKNLYVQASNAPGAAQTYTCALYSGSQGALAVTCTISGAAATGANDTTNSAAITAGEQLFLRLTASAGAAALTLSFGFTLTV